jgi:protein SCO1/2
MTERPGAALPLDALVRDERGATRALRTFILGKPTILALAYYRCPNLCTLVFNGLTDAFAKMKAKPGVAFNVVAVSFDPRDTPELARMKKRTYLSKLGIADEDSHAWRFLTGEKASVRSIADAVGFHYAWDPVSREYAHPTGIIVLTPQGKVDRYFSGIRYDAAALEKTLRESGKAPIRAAIGQFFLTCLHYNPRNSKRRRSS